MHRREGLHAELGQASNLFALMIKHHRLVPHRHQHAVDDHAEPPHASDQHGAALVDLVRLPLGSASKRGCTNCS